MARPNAPYVSCNDPNLRLAAHWRPAAGNQSPCISTSGCIYEQVFGVSELPQV